MIGWIKMDWRFYSVWAVATIFGVVTGTTFWAILVLVAVSYVVCRFLYGLASNVSMPDVLEPTRTPLLEMSWFQDSMAIADVVFVEGIGICSHQPLFMELDAIVEATFQPTRIDDLRPGMEEWIGHRYKWQALWLIDEGPYVGEWAMKPAIKPHEPHPDFLYLWVPFSDLEVVKGHRMMDVDGNLHMVEDNELLFRTTWDEQREYWNRFKD